jgi:hypothetical protein
LNQIFQFEEKGMKFPKVIALFISCVVGSSMVYVLLAALASQFSFSSLHSLSCVQGLSATMFALKVIVLFDPGSAGSS